MGEGSCSLKNRLQQKWENARAQIKDFISVLIEIVGADRTAAAATEQDHNDNNDNDHGPIIFLRGLSSGVFVHKFLLDFLI